MPRKQPLTVEHERLPADADGVTWAVVADLMSRWGDVVPWQVSIHASQAEAKAAAKGLLPPWVPAGAAVRVEAWWLVGRQCPRQRVAWAAVTEGRGGD